MLCSGREAGRGAAESLAHARSGRAQPNPGLCGEKDRAKGKAEAGEPKEEANVVAQA